MIFITCIFQAMAGHTQMDPTNRKKRLLEFSDRMNKKEECLSQLTKWNTTLDKSLVRFQGRALPQETMEFGEGKSSKNKDARNVDWTMASKMNPMFCSVPLKRWVFIYPKKNGIESESFLKLMQEVSKGFNYEMSNVRHFSNFEEFC